MTDVGELKSRVKAIQSASSQKEIYDTLVWLKRNVIASETLLRESKAGLAVGKLRTHDSKDVADLAKELVKKWKGEVDRAKAKAKAKGDGSASTSPATTPQASTSSKPPLQVDATKKSHTASTLSPTSPTTARTAQLDEVPTTITGERIRDTCIIQLYNALCFDSGAPVDQLLRCARAIEEAVLAQNKNDTSGTYRTKIRSLYLNLKDKGNPGLREAVISGEIPPPKLVTMTSQELASEERKADMKKINDANFWAALGSEEMAAETDAFQCSRCKQRKTRYRQQQTRSADEPMTTFITCTNCGNRWKFS